jgi:hypothetical protein
MEEQDSVARRDAVAGLGLLGGLAVVLVGTIFYRIINPSPPARASLEGLTIAAEIGTTAAPLAIQLPNLPAAEPMERDGEVSAAAFTTEVTSPGASLPPTPTFIAPSGR